ncbi:hypothetical protein KJJ36_14215 [Staphylococcus pseudoxylosus]|uniref:hypothetical protein n=1 Tax=Staphylococcus pseudoxylosus TaxID=2282419 RepID=UPI001F43361E|nr:hypothetical protein [Staphylococcus pseudoxylosus]MCE5003523.1 hypothetical protein [Staphylococcus pseudoxylosus]
MLYTLVWKSYGYAMYLGVYDSEEKALEIVAKDIAKRKFDEEIDEDDLQSVIEEYQVIQSELNHEKLVGIVN